MEIGLFETLMLAGLFVLILVVAVIGFISVRRLRRPAPSVATLAGGPQRTTRTSAEVAAIRTAEQEAAAILAEAEAGPRRGTD